MDGSVVPIAVVMHARRRVLSQLEKAGATGADSAIALAPSRRLQRKAISYFLRRGLLMEPLPGRYFVVPEKVAAWRKSVRTSVVIAIGTVIAAAAAVFAVYA